MIPRTKNDRPPSVWQQRRLRIAQENADRLRRKQEKLQAREQAEDEPDTAPRRMRTRPAAGRRPPPQRSNRAAESSAPARGGNYHTHVLPKSGVIGATIWALRAIALLLIVASTFGNYVQFAGGWETYAPIQEKIVLYAAGYQLICSLFQWGFKAMHWWPLYILALIASAVPSFLTYNAWVGPYLAPLLYGPWIAGVAIALATLAADALPEWVLVG